jgi:[ribosomal protein S18]-alanine N-acetyltransferase
VSRKIRLMRKEDIDQITEIDREAFSSMWPPVNFQRELKNRLARYLVVYDYEKPYIPIRKTRKNNNSSNIFSRLWQRLSAGKASSNIDSLDMEPEPIPVPLILGFAGFWLITDEAHIMNIAVRECYRNSGVGKLLLLSLIDLAMEMKADTVTLEVRASNTLAQDLYGKFGFVKCGTRRGYYSDNKEDAIIMTTESMKSASFQKRLIQVKEAYSKEHCTETIHKER